MTAAYHLLNGNAKLARASLQAIPESARDAAWWNDAAAAEYVLADDQNAMEHLTHALASVDTALRMDGASAPALFNRGLILERFGFRAAAAEAWRHYLAVESDGGWATEGRQHLQSVTRREESFDAAAERLYARLQQGDRAAAEALVRIDAGEARYFGEVEILARWGEARISRDGAAAAAQHLTAARTLGRALSVLNQEALLLDGVEAIDHAGPLELDALARGHVLLRDGRHMSKDRKPTDAETMLAGASRELEAGNSAMAAEARFFTAVEIFDQNRIDEAQRLFASLAVSVPERYAALHGYLAWMRGSYFVARAELGAAIHFLNDGVAVFDRLGERSNAAFLHDITSQVYDRVGDRVRARSHRLLALRELGKSNSFRLEHVVFGMIYDAAQRKEWLAAMSLLDLEVEIAKAVRDPELQANVLLRRTLVHARMGGTAAAEADLREATAIVDSVADPALRGKLQTDRDAAAALVAPNPEIGVRLLTGVLDFQQTKGSRTLIPDLFLRRGRMFLAMGDRRNAAADFEAGIAELEQHRETLPAGEARWGVLDAADELFEEAIEYALRDDPPHAFQYAERARARALSDTLLSGASSFDPAALPADVALIEYVALPRKLVIFAVTREGIRHEVEDINREELASQIERLSAEIQRGGDASRRNEPVDDLLLAPIRDLIGTRRQLVFVPDAATSTIPFSALLDPFTRQPLLEAHTISVCPSARMHLAARARQRGRHRDAVLIVDNPASGTMPPLPLAAAEADGVRAQYAAARRLSGAEATVTAFLTEAPRADVIHFAGHGSAGGDFAVLTLSDADGGAGSLDARAISKLPLSKTSVVVLAACRTADGPRRTEGTLSVAYAFLQAGAPAVVATLWPIDDREAAAFFPRLHHYLSQGLSVAEALRQAQLDYRRDPRNGHGAIWASVQSIGY